ncbi:hypothetical protein AO726_01015 [Pseudomonas sp. TTU2014-080ASC]|nr:hypothetical protein AO726_01015 [Pseudomonas sp. TTU2014-080ASC]
MTATTAFYLHADHLNTPRLATNHAGQEVWRWKSNAFGEGIAIETSGSGLSAINLRFPGQYYDSESGLYYNYFRDYDPQTGRYVESDPIGLKGGLNTYGYAYQNPINNFDPDGRLVWFLGLGALGGAGTSATAGAGFWTMGGLLGGAVLTASISGSTPQTSTETETKNCPKTCPPCRTVSGRIIPVGTLGYRPLDVIPDDQMQHGVYGSHHNMFIAHQNPNNCQCFWQKQSYVLKPEQLPATAVPMEHFAN